MTERSVTDATARAFDLVRASFTPLFLIGLLAAAPGEVLWDALEQFALARVSFNLDLASGLRLLGLLAGAAFVVLVLLLLVEALMWGALSEALARVQKNQRPEVGSALAEAGAKLKRYFASYCAFLVPAAVVDIALMCVAALTAVRPGWATAGLLALSIFAALPVYIWAMGFSLLLVPAAVRGHFGAEGFRAFWQELRGEWLGIFGVQLMVYAVSAGLAIAFWILKLFLPDTPSLDWQKMLDLVQQGNWQQAATQMLSQPEDWRSYLRDAVDVVRDALVFAFSGTLALCWYAGKSVPPQSPILIETRGSETPRSPISAP